MFHIFAYLNKYHNTELFFDTSNPCVEESDFELKDRTSSEFGRIQGTEEMPPIVPQPHGLGFIMSAKFDASDTVTRRSSTGFLVHLNSSLVYWSSLKQNNVG